MRGMSRRALMPPPRVTRSTALLLAAFAMILACVRVAAAAEAFRDRLAQDELVYFLLPDRFANGDASNDRGGLNGDRLVTGFDPTSKGFYHGGDLEGVLARLDY